MDYKEYIKARPDRKGSAIIANLLKWGDLTDIDGLYPADRAANDVVLAAQAEINLSAAAARREQKEREQKEREQKEVALLRSKLLNRELPAVKIFGRDNENIFLVNFTLTVPDKAVGRVIGPKGEWIRKLSEIVGKRVKVISDSSKTGHISDVVLMWIW